MQPDIEGIIEGLYVFKLSVPILVIEEHTFFNTKMVYLSLYSLFDERLSLCETAEKCIICIGELRS